MNSEKIIIAGDFEVLVTKRPGQKNLYIRVSPPDGKITVSAPAKISDKLIKNFILRKIPQITKARERIRNQFRQSKREYIYLARPVIFSECRICFRLFMKGIAARFRESRTQS